MSRQCRGERAGVGELRRRWANQHAGHAQNAASLFVHHWVYICLGDAYQQAGPGERQQLF